jgi:hypothetical protein
VFTAHGGYTSGQAYVDGLVPAVYVGAAVLGVGALAALFSPGRRRAAVGAPALAQATGAGASSR